MAARELAIGTRLSGSDTDLDGNVLPKNGLHKNNHETEMIPTGLLLKETIRSGRSIFYQGDVIVIGDVNPGAEIIAGSHKSGGFRRPRR